MNTKLEQQQRMFSLIEQCKTSGLTVRLFCQEHNIQEWCYYYWAKKHTELHSASGFIPVRVLSKKKTQTENTIDIYYPNGIRISVSSISPLSLLQTLLRLG